jgi:pimeloyl-ACP methyl ester carboxylesterase
MRTLPMAEGGPQPKPGTSVRYTLQFLSSYADSMTDLPNTSLQVVLVHGAWLGEWCWDQVADILRAEGHEVYPVSLTGHGQRRDESGPHITLADHVVDVIDVVRREDLHDVVLVGHSYGGRVITQAWAQVADVVARLVYVDAHAPVEIPEMARPAWAAQNAQNPSDAPQMIPFAGVRLDAEMVGEEEEARIRSLLVEHSAATIAGPWKVDLPAELPRTYVHATGEALAPFSAYAAVIAQDPTWTYYEIEGPHLLLFTHAREVAAAILGH